MAPKKKAEAPKEKPIIGRFSSNLKVNAQDICLLALQPFRLRLLVRKEFDKHGYAGIELMVMRQCDLHAFNISQSASMQQISLHLHLLYP